jgi:bifunctional enzyme CysN/CysC
MDNKLLKSNSISKVDEFIKSQEDLSLLRFITCGSVDDGKSTLIGRILYESKTLFEDQLTTLKNDSKKHGTQGDNIDFSLLVDGLSAEREQGITIDVAYRFFSTNKRKFIVADTPGHEQYTRNMITGASTSDLAIILVDARKGILEQTKRHSFIASLIGIDNIILAINKMDLINFDEKKYDKIVESYKKFSSKLNFKKIYEVPISALQGDNIIESSKNLSWYKGSSLLPLLETIDIKSTKNEFSMPVQFVNRPNSDYRAYCGKISSGSLSVGDSIKVLPSGRISNVKSINVGDRPLKHAVLHQSISLTLDKEIDISRGDVIFNSNSACEVSSLFDAQVSWLSEDRCFKGRSYIAKAGALKTRCQIVDLKHKFDINTLAQKPAKYLDLNDIANITISLDRELPFDDYSSNKTLGSLILIDPISNQTVAAIMINHSLRRAKNIHKHDLSISRKLREGMNGHSGKLLWFTGLSGSGKSTIADALEKELYKKGIRTYMLDGDNIRHGLNNDLGFDEQDRVENIRRVAEVSKLMVDAGLFVLASFISPYNSDRSMARQKFSREDFTEIYIKTSLEVAESRDPKGLYKKARLGKIPNFTGISSPYEEPSNPDIIINTNKNSVKNSVDLILKYLEANDSI